MSRREKRLAALRRNPKNVRPDELDAVLSGLGFTIEHESTSHKTYRLGGNMLSVPQNKPFLKPVYVREALTLIDELGLVEE